MRVRQFAVERPVAAAVVCAAAQFLLTVAILVVGRKLFAPHAFGAVKLTAQAYCDRAGVSFMQPFGRLVLDDDVYWVYQMSSWRDEAYTVSRVRPDDVAPSVVAFGGGCPR